MELENQNDSPEKSYDVDIEIKKMQLEKLTKEKDKLELEIVELKKPFVKKFLTPVTIAQISLAVFPLIYAICSGFFNAQFQEYKANKATLLYEQVQLKVEKEKIKDSIDLLHLKLDVMGEVMKTDSTKLGNSKISLKLKTDSLATAADMNSSLTLENEKLKKIKDAIYGDIKIKNAAFADVLEEKQVLQDTILAMRKKERNYKDQVDHWFRSYTHKNKEYGELKGRMNMLSLQFEEYKKSKGL